MTAGFSELSLKSEQLDDLVCIHVSGDLDHASAPTLRLELEQSLNDEVRSIDLDLGGVTFIDSAALQVFVSVDATLRQRDGRLTIEAASPVVTRILEVSGLDRLFAS